MTQTNAVGVQKVSAVSVKDSVGSNTYSLGDDYRLDADAGRVYIVPGGAIALAADLAPSKQIEVQFAYTPTAGSISRVSSGASGASTGAVVFRPKNASGPNRTLVISSAALAASGDIPFITDNDLAKFTLDVGVNEKDSATPQILIDGVLVTA